TAADSRANPPCSAPADHRPTGSKEGSKQVADYAFPGGGTAGDGQARRTASCACAGPGAAQADSLLPCVPRRGTGCTVPGSLTTEQQLTCKVGGAGPDVVPFRGLADGAVGKVLLPAVGGGLQSIASTSSVRQAGASNSRE